MKNEIKFELKGFDELSKNLKKVTKEVESIEKQKKANDEPFSPAFMTKYTQFNTIDEMVEKSPFKVESEEDLKNIPGKEWDTYVSNKTSFQSWNEMMSKAVLEYQSKQVQQSLKKVFKKYPKKH